MIVTSAAAEGFKNLKEVYIEPHPEYNFITGMNAQGKTNIIEAIWLMTGCSSFRGSNIKDFIGLEKNDMSIELKFRTGRREQNISYRMSRNFPKERKIKLNGVEMNGTGKLFENFKCVVFTPDDIDLIRGGPNKRRSFIDLCMCQLRNGNMDAVKRYSALIAQRNALLKAAAYGNGKPDTIQDWDRQTAAIGTFLSQRRYQYIKILNETCSELYGRITDGRERLEISYVSNVFGNVVEDYERGEYAVMKYYNKLLESIDSDIRLGYTSCGAHRDDIVIKINGMNIKEFGSQGQKKTAALVLKLGQAEIYYKNSDEAPVILLDDVMGELDESRQRLVFEVVKGMQVFITACNENSVNCLSGGKHFRIENGRIV